MKETSVTFIIICYNEPKGDFCVSLGSLLQQKDPRWKAIVMHDGPNDEIANIVKSFDDNRISWSPSEERQGSWGCYNRIRGLKLVDTEWVIQMTAQEYYTPNAVHTILSAVSQCDFVYWPTVHHSFGYNILNSEPAIRKIDWSNFAIKTWIANRVGINQPEHYCADGIFVEDCMKSGHIKKATKIPKILSIKN